MVQCDSWHEFVLDKFLAGWRICPLSPGNVGTTPVQNIGAYGTEIKKALSFLCGAFYSKPGTKFTKTKMPLWVPESILKNRDEETDM
jgi:UDP-N-acetylmuramate dehydrogenase